MILPPFFGFASKYDEEDIRRAIITYLSADATTFSRPTSIASVSYVSTDALTYAKATQAASVTFLGVDVLGIQKPSNVASITYGGVDICTFDPPPRPPEITVFISGLSEDSAVELAWSTPFSNRCDITNYILEYTDCFLSYIDDENSNHLLSESSDSLITETYRYNCNYQEFNKSRLLLQNLDRLATVSNNLIVTEQSSGVGLVNFAVVDELSNGQDYIFRVAAVNCAGVGEFGYSEIFTPIGPSRHSYCDILAFLQPNSTTDIYASLIDYSCREKEINHIAGVSVSSVSKFGAGSLYFDGVFDNGSTPATYSHLQIDHKNETTFDSWSLVDDFTIELWVRPYSFPVSSNQTLVSCYYQNNYDDLYDGNYRDWYWKLYIAGNSVKFNIWIANMGPINPEDLLYEVTLTANNIVLPTDEFTHIAVSRFNNYIRLYLNGVRYDRQYFDKNIIIPPENNPYLIIGANQTDAYIYSDEFNTGRGTVNQPFKGYIDDIMISKEARYGKNFVPEKYAEAADCQDCGGYISTSSMMIIDHDFIP